MKMREKRRRTARNKLRIIWIHLRAMERGVAVLEQRVVEMRERRRNWPTVEVPA